MRRTSGRGQDPPRTYADTSAVTSRAGRVSLVHVVSCPHCQDGAHHLHRSDLRFTEGRRSCPRHFGRYVVVSGVLGILREVA